MTPSLLGVVSAALLALLWLSGRRRSRPILRSCDTSAVAALNRAQLALVVDRRSLESASGPVPLSAGADGWGLPPGGLAEQLQQVRQQPPMAGAAQRLALRRQLHAAARGGDRERLEAMTAAAHWPDRALLPLLHRGLRDPDPAVMRQAAVAMEAFRGRPASGGGAPVQLAPLRLDPLASARPSPLPRNAAPRSVSRTR